MLRFRSLGARITFFFVILLITVQGVLLALVSASGEHIAKDRVAAELKAGERIVQRLLEQGSRQLSDAVRLLAAGFGLRTAIATRDFDTIVSVLRNHGKRIDASVVMLADLDRNLLADTLHEERRNTSFPFPALVTAAQRDGKASAIVLIDGTPYQIVVVPVLAPVPIAWVAMGFVIDDRVALDRQAVSKLQVSFMSHGTEGRWAMHASTLPPALRALMLVKASVEFTGNHLFAVDLGGDSLQTLAPVIGESAEGKVVAVLQRSLREGLEPFDRLRKTLLLPALASVVLSVVGSMLIARQVTQPVNRLAGVTNRIKDGDYGSRAETGYIKQITRWVIERTFRQVGEWHRDGLDLVISVNIPTRALVGAAVREVAGRPQPPCRRATGGRRVHGVSPPRGNATRAATAAAVPGTRLPSS